MSTDDNDHIPMLNRRTLLKSVGGTAMLGSVATPSIAVGEGTITVEQGGTTYEVTPFTGSRTVDEFYSYSDPRGASSNTPDDLARSDATRLFFYAGPNGLSLVVIHDRPNDGDGGEVVFDFDSLPADGSWVVKDDPGDNFSKTQPHWNWASCCTDGGAFHGNLEDFQFSIAPSFHSGISSWQLLSGDPSEPDVTELTLGDPITVTVGEGIGGGLPAFDDLRSYESKLAERVTDVSLSISQVERSQEVQSLLQTKLDNDVVSEDTASEALRRMQLAENVTETVLVTTGPADTITPEDPDTLIGSANDEDYDMAERITDALINAIVGLAASVGAAAAAVSRLPLYGGALTTSIDEMLETIITAIPAIVGIAEGLEDIIATFTDSETQNTILDTAKEVSEPAKTLATGVVAEQKEEFKNLILYKLENDGYIPEYDMRFLLEETAEDLSGKVTERERDPEPRFSGTLAGAQQASRDSIERIVENTETVKNEIEALEVTGKVFQVIAGAVALASVAFAGAPAALAVVFGTAAALTQIVGNMKGFKALDTAKTAHRDALIGVLDGTSPY